MNLVPWKRETSLSRPLSTLQQEMNRLFDDFFGRDFALEPFRGMAWSPALDIAETNDSVVVKAELPGIDPKQVEITLANDLLTIKGGKKEEKEDKGKNYHRIERSYGAFERTVSLPAPVKSDQVEARFKDGVLTIEMPKVEEAKTKAVKIKVE